MLGVNLGSLLYGDVSVICSDYTFRKVNIFSVREFSSTVCDNVAKLHAITPIIIMKEYNKRRWGLVVVFSYIGLFQKNIIFLVRKFQKFCVWFLTLYAFIISKVMIRTQDYTNASLISATVVISYQNV